MRYESLVSLSVLGTLWACSPKPTDRVADSGRADTPAATSATSPGADSADVLAAERRIWEGLKATDHSVLDTLFAGAVDMDPNGITLQFTPGTASRSLEGCSVKSYAIDSAHVKALSADQRLLTYKVTFEWPCRGQRIPSPAYEMALWQRKGGAWALVAHAAAIAMNAR